jgi:hypothetical protein
MPSLPSETSKTKTPMEKVDKTMSDPEGWIRSCRNWTLPIALSLVALVGATNKAEAANEGSNKDRAKEAKILKYEDLAAEDFRKFNSVKEVLENKASFEQKTKALQGVLEEDKPFSFFGLCHFVRKGKKIFVATDLREALGAANLAELTPEIVEKYMKEIERRSEKIEDSDERKKSEADEKAKAFAARPPFKCLTSEKSEEKVMEAAVRRTAQLSGLTTEQVARLLVVTLGQRGADGNSVEVKVELRIRRTEVPALKPMETLDGGLEAPKKAELVDSKILKKAEAFAARSPFKCLTSEKSEEKVMEAAVRRTAQLSGLTTEQVARLLVVTLGQRGADGNSVEVRVEMRKSSKPQKKEEDNPNAGKKVSIGELATTGGASAKMDKLAEKKTNSAPSIHSETAHGEQDKPAAKIDKWLKIRVNDQVLKKTRLAYERQLKRNPNLKGKVIVSVEFDESGKVASAKLIGDSVKNDDLAKDIVEEISKISLGNLEEGVVIEVPAILAPSY